MIASRGPLLRELAWQVPVSSVALIVASRGRQAIPWLNSRTKRRLALPSRLPLAAQVVRLDRQIVHGVVGFASRPIQLVVNRESLLLHALCESAEIGQHFSQALCEGSGLGFGQIGGSHGRNLAAGAWASNAIALSALNVTHSCILVDPCAGAVDTQAVTDRRPTRKR